MAEDIQSIPFVNNENLPVIFTDIIEIAVNSETAQLRIGLKDVKSESAVGTHKIIMTTPHFLRLAEKIKDSADEIIKQIETITNENINS